MKVIPYSVYPILSDKTSRNMIRKERFHEAVSCSG